MADTEAHLTDVINRVKTAEDTLQASEELLDSKLDKLEELQGKLKETKEEHGIMDPEGKAERIKRL